MRKFKYLRTPNYRTIELPNKKMVDVYDVLYDSKVDLDKGEYLSRYDVGYAKSTLPTFNDLAKQNIIREISCVEHYDISFPYEVKKVTTTELIKVQKEFKEHGFDVSLRALRHNYYSWLADLKSGYRGKSYHLFSPCGCNPLSFRATTLHRKCKDWQTTYSV